MSSDSPFQLMIKLLSRPHLLRMSSGSQCFLCIRASVRVLMGIVRGSINIYRTCAMMTFLMNIVIALLQVSFHLTWIWQILRLSLKEMFNILWRTRIWLLSAMFSISSYLEMLPKCISDNQSAFVLGRSILDNVMVAIKVIHSMKLKTKGNGGSVAGLKEMVVVLHWNWISQNVWLYGLELSKRGDAQNGFQMVGGFNGCTSVLNLLITLF